MTHEHEPQSPSIGEMKFSTDKKPPQTPTTFWGKLWKEVLEPVVFAVVVTQFLATLVGVDGVSMMPNLRDKERVFVPKYETWLHKAGIGDFKRGDIVIFKPPRDAAAKEPGLTRNFLGLTYRPFLIKRLIGLPGDKIRVEGGEIYINGAKLDASWTTDFWQEQGCWDQDSPLANQATSNLANLVPDQAEITVPKGHYFVVGDNRTPTGSEDSRLFGPVEQRDMAGRAAAIVWPIMRKTNAKYDCASHAVATDGPSKLNWRMLPPPQGFGQVPAPQGQ